MGQAKTYISDSEKERRKKINKKGEKIGNKDNLIILSYTTLLYFIANITIFDKTLSLVLLNKKEF